MEQFPKKKDGFADEKLIVVPLEVFGLYQKHPLVQQLLITDVGYFPKALHHYRERWKGISENILIYCIAGRGAIHMPDNTVNLHPGEVFCIPAYVGHRYFANQEDPWSIMWIHFRGDNCAYYPFTIDNVIRFDTPQENLSLQSLFYSLIDVLERNCTLGNFIHASQLLSVILSEIYYREKSSHPDKHNQRLTTVIQYMLKHIDTNLSLDDIAGHMHLSKSYLNRIFKEYTQHTTMNFYTRLKMQQACKMLKTNNLMVYEVSEKVGFTDTCYFSRVFKRTVGISPRDYQNGKDASGFGENLELVLM